MGIKFAYYFIISNKICNAIDISQLLIEISSLQNPIGNVLSVSPPPYESVLMGYRLCKEGYRHLFKGFADIFLQNCIRLAILTFCAILITDPCFV